MGKCQDQWKGALGQWDPNPVQGPARSLGGKWRSSVIVELVCSNAPAILRYEARMKEQSF
eukprot:2032983-Amphidinium_carterae.1